MNTTSTWQKNATHRADLARVKIGRSEYMRADGVTIRKHDSIRAWWTVNLPNGERAQMVIGGEPQPHMPAAASSLTFAKFAAEDITPATPAYVRA